MRTLFRRVLLRRPAIRTLVMLWATSVLLVWAILVGGWFAAKSQLSRINDQVLSDIRALDATRELETAVLAYRHDDLLWHATAEARYWQQEREHLAKAQRIVLDFAPHVNTPEERELWLTIQEKLEAFRNQPQLNTAALAPAEIGSTTELFSLVQDFQQINRDQMEASIQASEDVRARITQWSEGLSILTALLLGAGVLVLLRRIAGPTSTLTKAVKLFGEGDFSARAPVPYNDELGVVARTFNNMAGDIADREKNRLQFVAMVVHDLKNPVLAIEMATRLLHGSAATEEERRGYLDGITRETAHLRGVIRDLTDDIQVANGRFSLHKADVDLGALVLQFIQAQRQAFTAHEIAVQTDEGCMIQGDARRIERVVMNLLSNAVKYSPPKTRVTVRVQKEDSQAVLTVCDQGPGIAEDDLRVLFQPFGRGRSADALAEGTGMGLYVVKQIVEAHGGRIDVLSELGHGATFRVQLPLASPQEDKNSSILLKSKLERSAGAGV